MTNTKSLPLCLWTNLSYGNKMGTMKKPVTSGSLSSTTTLIFSRAKSRPKNVIKDFLRSLQDERDEDGQRDSNFAATSSRRRYFSPAMW